MQVLRPFQKVSLQLLETPGHVLCVSPTGSGKTLIAEQFSLKTKARTVFISPLIALARQQRDRLKAAGLTATLATGGENAPPPEGSGVWILSPEKLFSKPGARALERLRHWRPDFLVVDECHCLWEWGKDFRPCFNLLPGLLQEGPIPRSLWLTATLPPRAREELLSRLPGPVKEVGRFQLPPRLTIRTLAVPPHLKQEALDHLLPLLLPEPGILFVPTRAQCERWTLLLRAKGISAVPYHAGMGREERRNAEARVSSGKDAVVVATSAFGLGMDFPHLRWVVLTHAPHSLLSLAQAFGRVARGEGEGRAYVLWDPRDHRLREPSQDSMATLRYLESRGDPVRDLEDYFNVRPRPQQETRTH